MIKGKIDITKIKGVRLIEKDGREWVEITQANLYKGKNGARYLDIVMFEVANSKYGDDWRITQDVSKEARERGERGEILGNAKNWSKGGAPKSAPASPAQQQIADEDIPF